MDRVVILGDGIELRDTPQRAAAGLAGEFLAQVAGALGRDGELVLTAGNHDHGLVAGWIDGRLMTEPSGFLGLEERIDPQDCRAARRDDGRAGGAHAAVARLPRAVAARRRVRAARPLLRRAHHGADLRAPRGGRDGALDRAPAGAGRDAGRLRGRARPDLRVDARAHAALRPRGDVGGRTRLRPHLHRAHRRGAPPPSVPHGRLRRRLPGRGDGRQRGRHRPAAAQPLRRRPAPRLPARDLRGGAPPRHRRAPCDLGPLAPRRPVAGRRSERVGDGRPAPGSSTRARGSISRTSSATRRTARPTGPAPPSSSRTAARRGSCACWGTGGTRSCDPRGEAGPVAGEAGAGLAARAPRPCGGGARRAGGSRRTAPRRSAR